MINGPLKSSTSSTFSISSNKKSTQKESSQPYYTRDESSQKKKSEEELEDQESEEFRLVIPFNVLKAMAKKLSENKYFSKKEISFECVKIETNFKITMQDKNGKIIQELLPSQLEQMDKRFNAQNPPSSGLFLNITC